MRYFCTRRTRQSGSRTNTRASSTYNLALLKERGSSPSQAIFKRFGITVENFMEALQKVRGSQRVTSQNPEGTYDSLKRFGRDLVELARQGKIDPVIGRDAEIRRAIRIQSRRTKNNPVLIGEPGVGKTAVVEGLAQRILAGRTFPRG